MKKYFNKSIFKDKSFIKMICFTIVLLLVLVLGNTFGYVSADSGGSSSVGWLNKEDYESSDEYNSNNLYVNFVSTEVDINNSNLSISYEYFSDFDWGSISNVPSDFDASSITHYFITGSSYPSNYDVYLWEGSDYTHAYYDGSSNSIVLILGNTSGKVYRATANPYGTGTQLMSVVMPDSISKISSNYLSESGQDISPQQTNFVRVSLPGTSPCCLLTNSDLLTVQGSAQQGAVGYDFLNYYFGGSQNNIVNVNYMFESAPSLKGFDNLSGVTNGEENIVDLDGIGSNMYADYADFYLNNYTGNIYHNFRDVSVCFTSNLNDYIENYIANDNTDLDEYSIWLDYQVYVDFYYQTVVDYGNVGVDLSAQFANVTLGADYNHDLIFTTDYHWACNYVFEPSSSDSPYIDSGYLLSAEKFVNDNNSIFTMPFSGLFAYLSPQGGYMSSSSGSKYDTNITLYQLMDLIDDNGIIWSGNYDGLNQFKLTCTAKIIYDDGTNMASSGNYIETFNLLDGSSTVDSDSMLTNYNPSITNTDSAATLPSTSTSGSSVASSSTGNVTQTVNVSNEGAKYIPSLISNLIPTSLSDTGTGLVSTFSTMAQTNGFISVMASTVPAIPSTVWTYLTNYLGISLYLLACAFVLRLILDLL